MRKEEWPRFLPAHDEKRGMAPFTSSVAWASSGSIGSIATETMPLGILGLEAEEVALPTSGDVRLGQQQHLLRAHLSVVADVECPVSWL